MNWPVICLLFQFTIVYHGQSYVHVRVVRRAKHFLLIEFAYTYRIRRREMNDALVRKSSFTAWQCYDLIKWFNWIAPKVYFAIGSFTLLLPTLHSLHNLFLSAFAFSVISIGFNACHIRLFPSFTFASMLHALHFPATASTNSNCVYALTEWWNISSFYRIESRSVAETPSPIAMCIEWDLIMYFRIRISFNRVEANIFNVHALNARCSFTGIGIHLKSKKWKRNTSCQRV